MYCLECNNAISLRVFEYSTEKYGIPLCIIHQEWIELISKQTTYETIRLYFALKARGVSAELEKFDGYKHIDIAIVEAKVNIEVDGGHHIFSNKQALADLKRTFYSFQKGFLTLRIPNSLVYDEDDLEETADYIVDFLLEHKNKNFRK